MIRKKWNKYTSFKERENGREGERDRARERERESAKETAFQRTTALK